MATTNNFTALTEERLAVMQNDVLVGFQQASAVAAYTVNAVERGTLEVGQKIKVPLIPAITIEDYDGDDLTMGDITVTSADLTADQQRAWSFKLDNVNEIWVRSAVENGLLARAGYDVGLDMNAKFLAQYANVHADNKLNSDDFKSGGGASDAIVPSAAENSDYYVGKILARIARIFDENDAPYQDRVFFCPPFFVEKLIRANLTKMDAPEVVKQQAIINGFVARLYGMDIVSTNKLTVDTDTFGYAFQRNHLLTGMGTNKFRVVEMEKNFKALFKGVVVYGSKVYQSKFGISLRLNDTTE